MPPIVADPPSPSWVTSGPERLKQVATTVAAFSLEVLATAEETVASLEEQLDLEPLVHLPSIGAIACTTCRHTLPASQRGLARHLQSYHGHGTSLTAEESRAQAAQLSKILERCGGLTPEAAGDIPHGCHYFPSLRLYTDSLMCTQAGCGWVYAGVVDLLKVGKRHMNHTHGVYLHQTASHETHFVRGLPVQRIERLQSGRAVQYFLTALPKVWTERPRDASSSERLLANAPKTTTEESEMRKSR